MTPGEEGTQTSKYGESFHGCHQQEASCFWRTKHSTCTSYRAELQITLPIPLAVSTHHRRMETSSWKENIELCMTGLQQHLVSWKALLQPVLLAALETQWCSTAIWFRLASQIVSTQACGASASKVLEVDGETAQNMYVAGTDSHQMAIQNSSQKKSVTLSRCKSYPWEKSSQLPFSSDSSSRRTVFQSGPVLSHRCHMSDQLTESPSWLGLGEYFRQLNFFA